MNSSTTLSSPPVKKWPLAVAAVAGVVAGVLLGNSSGDQPESADSRPAVTATQTVTATAPAVTVSAEAPAENMVWKEELQVCFDALGSADQLVDITSRFAYMVGEHMTDESVAWSAAADMDNEALGTYMDQMGTFTQDVQSLTAEVEDSGYPVNREKCLEVLS